MAQRYLLNCRIRFYGKQTAQPAIAVGAQPLKLLLPVYRELSDELSIGSAEHVKPALSDLPEYST